MVEPIMFVINNPVGHICIYLGKTYKTLTMQNWKEFKNGAKTKEEIRIKVEQLHAKL